MLYNQYLAQHLTCVSPKKGCFDHKALPEEGLAHAGATELTVHCIPQEKPSV